MISSFNREPTEDIVSFNCLVMPSSGRRGKEIDTAKRTAAEAPGQKTLLIFFGAKPTSSSSSDLDDNVNPNSKGGSGSDATVCGNEIHEVPPSHEDNTDRSQQSESSISINKPTSSNASDTDTDWSGQWVTDRLSYTKADRVSSKLNGRYLNLGTTDLFEKFPWIKYNRVKNAIFCDFCTDCPQAGDKSPFIYFNTQSVGFRSWGKLSERLSEHEKTPLHGNARACFKAAKLDGPSSIPSLLEKNQKLRREGLQSHFHTIKTLLRQGLAIRGHGDENSNIVVFNEDKARTDSGLRLLLNEGRFMSHDAISEQEEMLILHARRDLNKEIRDRDFYSIICDEATDISKTEQMTFVLRTCDDDYEIREDFIGVRSCDDGTTAAALLENITDVLLRCQLENQKIICGTFDGAAAMKALGGMIKQEIAPHALYIHCVSHCNELVIKDATKASQMITDAQALVEDLYALAGASPKRVLLFKNIQQNESDEVLKQNELKTLRNLSQTRWTTRGPAAEVIVEKHRELVILLRSLADDRSVTADCRAKAKGLLRKVISCTEMFGVIAFMRIVTIMEGSSKLLQSMSLTAEDASYAINSIKEKLQSMRTLDKFDEVLNQTLQLSSVEDDVTQAESSKKRKITQKAMTDFLCTDSFPAASRADGKDGKSSLRAEFYGSIDALLSSVQSRFEQTDLTFVQKIETATLSAIKDGASVDVRKELSRYDKLLDLAGLKQELSEFPVHLKLYNMNYPNDRVYSVKSIATICQIMNASMSTKRSLPNLHRLLKLYQIQLL